MEFSTAENANVSKDTSLIEILADDRDDERIKTFILHCEDHTLGNSLRWVLMKDKDVQFCGYTIPHPSQREVHLRIQTFKKPAVEVLKEGLVHLSDLTKLISGKVKEKAEAFKANSEDHDAMQV